jgi:hypothetical protein
MKNIFFCLVFFLILIWGNLADVCASPVTVDFSGTVTQVNFDPDDPYGGTISFGTSLNGSFTFDSTAADAIADPSTGSYSMAGPPYEFSMDIGGNIFNVSDSLSIGILNGFVDQYTIYAQTSSGELTMELFLEDEDGSVFSDDSLPGLLPDLNLFETRDFHLIRTVIDPDTGGISQQDQIDGIIAPAAPVTVPEPSTMILLLPGIGGLSFFRQLKKR